VRLHTDFHDYYDNAIGYGVDEKVHYNRYTKKAAIDIKSKLDRPFHRESGLLGFCGKAYPFIELNRYGHNLDEHGRLKIIETRFAFDADEYLKIKQEWAHCPDDFYSYAYTKDPKLKQFFDEWSRDNDGIFLEHKVPVWIARFYAREPNGILNPRLKDYGFERRVDALTAFQEISMYLANILVEQKEIAIIEDRYRIEQHGFDLKKSFRNTKDR
jgi:hypothetical protein